MKKIFVTIMTLAAAIFQMQAVEDASVSIQLESDNNRTSVVTINQAAIYTANEQNATEMLAQITNTTTAVNIYAMAPYGKMAIMGSNYIRGTYVGFTTNSRTNYTLTFGGVTGSQLYLIDHGVNPIHVEPIVENGVYPFTAAASSTIEDRFEIGIPAPTVQLYNEWDDNWATPLNFTDNYDGTVSATKTFTGNGYCPFKIVEDGNWLGNGNAFKRDYTSATGINNDDANMTLWVDVPGEYTFTWNYETNALSITMPALPTVQMKGSWDSWADFVDFTPAADGLTASAVLNLDPADWYQFKVALNGTDWRSFEYVDDATSPFTRTNNEHNWINADHTDNMSINADQAGDYTFTWTYVENKLTITFPAAPVPTCTTVRTGMTAGNYYTICLPKAVTAANGASFWNMSNRGDGVAYLEEAELPLVAGRPYIIQAEDAELCVEYSGEDAAAGAFGALHGTFVAMDQAALNAAGADIYLLKNNELWLVSGQTDNSLAANRAYIKYGDLNYSTPNPAPGRRVRAIPMQNQGATGVENLNADEAPVKMFIDGQMYILRGEHMFDATGRMVK